MMLATREKKLGLTTNINRKEIYPASRLVSMITGVSVQPNKAIVGANAFAHESGIHVDGVLKNPLTYEIMTPEEVGIGQNNLVLGKHSGRAALKARLGDMGYELDRDNVEKLFQAFKRLADKKKEVFNEDLEALIADEILRIPLRWRLDYMNIVSGTVTVPHGHGAPARLRRTQAGLRFGQRSGGRGVQHHLQNHRGQGQAAALHHQRHYRRAGRAGRSDGKIGRKRSGGSGQGL